MFFLVCVTLSAEWPSYNVYVVVMKQIACTFIMVLLSIHIRIVLFKSTGNLRYGLEERVRQRKRCRAMSC